MKYICDSCEKYPCSADETKLRLSCPAYSPKPKPITNYDLLIRKTPEELARFVIGEDFCELLCGSPPVCDGCWSCEGKMLAWLKSPVKEGE